jgi:hypothetical protein
MVFTLVNNLIKFIFLVLSVIVLFPTVYAQNDTQIELATVDPAVAEANLPSIKIEQLSATPVPVGDYVVGPGRTEVVVRPGETVTRYITVGNRIADGRTFTLSVEDMSGTADGSENVVLLGDQSGPYSLREYISFPADSITLNLNTRATVPVTISVPPNAEPGGYYGAVLVSTVDTSENTTTAAQRSPVIARVGTLFFITVPGEVEISGELQELSTTNDQIWFQSGPIDFNVVYENTGSVHLNPYGEIRVTNILGEEVGYVQLDPWFVLPKSLRLREVTWDREFLLGRYTITAMVNRGYDDIIDTQSLVIWVLPWKVLLAVFTVLFVIFFVARFFFRTFEFKRRA